MPKRKSGLAEIVGEETYSVWIAMLQRLVPQGRTHRLAPMIAGMLQYATEVATEKYGKKPEAGSVAEKLFAAYDDNAEEKLLPIVKRLFKDAGVESERVSKGGDHYSVAEEAAREFLYWYEYSWDS
jgi:hypothetical protein